MLYSKSVPARHHISARSLSQNNGRQLLSTEQKIIVTQEPPYRLYSGCDNMVIHNYCYEKGWMVVGRFGVPNVQWVSFCHNTSLRNRSALWYGLWTFPEDAMDELTKGECKRLHQLFRQECVATLCEEILGTSTPFNLTLVKENEECPDTGCMITRILTKNSAAHNRKML